MFWKKELRKLEDTEQFEQAIELIGKVIKDDPNDVDRYIFMLYFLADLIMEPHIRMVNKQGIRHFYNKEYEALARKYFYESYFKFILHPDKRIRAQYLYYVGRTAVFGAHVFGIPDEHADEMINQAKEDDPDNPVYKIGESDNIELAKQLLDPNSQVRKILADKGTIGDYLVRIHKSWAHHPDIF